MSYAPSEEWGTVNLGVDVLQGHGEQSQPGKLDYNKNHPSYPKQKEQYNPGRNQELALPADIFPMNNTEKEGESNKLASIHQRIKEMIGEGVPRNEAIAKAKEEAKGDRRGDIGTITPKDVYRSKYQAVTPEKQPSVFSQQVQNYPFI